MPRFGFSGVYSGPASDVLRLFVAVVYPGVCGVSRWVYPKGDFVCPSGMGCVCTALMFNRLWLTCVPKGSGFLPFENVSIVFWTCVLDMCVVASIVASPMVRSVVWRVRWSILAKAIEDLDRCALRLCVAVVCPVWCAQREILSALWEWGVSVQRLCSIGCG